MSNPIGLTKFVIFITAIALILIMLASKSSPHSQAQDVAETGGIVLRDYPFVDTSLEPVAELAYVPAAKPQPVAHRIGEYGTPIPTVEETQPAQPWVRSDGLFNYCFQLPDGSWTTVIGQVMLQPGVYYFAGSIDPSTEAPAYAVESQQWCKENDE